MLVKRIKIIQCICSDGKPTAKDPLAATESPEEQPRGLLLLTFSPLKQLPPSKFTFYNKFATPVTTEAVTSPPRSQEASAPADPEVNAQTPPLENAEEGSK